MEYDDPEDEVHLLVRKFLKDVEQHIKGLPLASSSVNTTDPFHAGLVQTVHGAFNNFCLDIHRTAPQFYPWSKGRSYQPWLTAVARKDAATGRVGDIHYVDDVMDMATKSRTRELPGIYPFEVRVVLIREALRSWWKLVTIFFDKVDEHVTNHLEKLVQTHFGKFEHGGLMDAMRCVHLFNVVEGMMVMVVILCSAVVDQVVQTLFKSAKKILQSVCESESQPWTQNDEYYFLCRNEFLSTYRTIYRESTRSDVNLLSSNSDRTANNILSGLVQLGIHGVTKLDLAKLMPPNPFDAALDIMAEVRAYFQGETIEVRIRFVSPANSVCYAL